MIFGNWGEIVVGGWGVLAIATTSAAETGYLQKRISTVRAMYTADVGVRTPAAFSVATSIT
jgi:hypothetical protein